MQYHHGNLRDALLDAAEHSIEEGGVDQLSLRDLARRVGVSHSAPRAHFVDRQSLLDALAERGFARLGVALRAADSAAGSSFDARLRAVASAYVDFAVRRPNLVSLMFATKPGAVLTGQDSAILDTLSVVPRLIEEGIASGRIAPTDPARAALLISATIRGIVAMVATESIAPDAVGPLIDDAVDNFLRGSAR